VNLSIFGKLYLGKKNCAQCQVPGVWTDLSCKAEDPHPYPLLV
jgi:hypothetical protein